MSAEIIDLSGWRAAQEPDLDIDLETAVDVAMRDLEEIRRLWGTPTALQRLKECEDLLRAAFMRG